MKTRGLYVPAGFCMMALVLFVHCMPFAMGCILVAPFCIMQFTRDKYAMMRMFRRLRLVYLLRMKYPRIFYWMLFKQSTGRFSRAI